MRDAQQIQQRITAEQVYLVFRQYPIAALAGSLVSLVVALVLRGEVPETIVYTWLIVQNLLLVSGYTLVLRYHRNRNKNMNLEWKRFYLFSIAAIAVSWSSLAYFLSYELPPIQQTFLIILLVGVAASALVLAVPLFDAYFVYTSVPMASVITWLMFQKENTLTGLGSLGILFYLLLLVAGKSLNQQLINTLRLRFENMDLANEVKQLNQNLEKRVAEKSRALFESEERFNLAMQGANDGLWDWNISTNKAYFSPRWKSMLGYNESEIEDKPKEWRKRLHRDDVRKVLSAMRSHMQGVTETYESIHRIRHKNGQYLWVLDRGKVVFDEKGKPYRMVGTQVDITFQKKLEQKFKSANIKLKHEIKERMLAQNELAHLAKHDPLTELPNRILFYEQLQNAIMRAEMEGEAIAVLLVDLDNFKHVNDTLGHPIGDKLLMDVAKRLTAIVNKNYFLSRFGGDEFLVILEGCSDTFLVDAYAREIIELISKPFHIDEQEIRIGCSIGITLFPDHGKEPDILIRDADIAMYNAKEHGKNTYHYFTDEMDQQISEKAVLRNMLHGVLENNELEVLYQPQIDTNSGSVTGIEALLRWNSEEVGQVGPDKFIPLLEEIGLISEVGKWVLRQACTHAVSLMKKGLSDFSMAVNFSPRQFLDANLVEDIEIILSETGLQPKFLEIEITENIFMEDLDLVNQTLSSLKELGVSITIDDFGTGYSSLGYLKRFPINGVKIDKVFIGDLVRNNDSRELVAAVIAMAKGLNMQTLVAEGVENESQLKFLRKAGCPTYQGYLYSMPMPFAALEQHVLPKPRLKSI
ncbi:MAG: bifunctional diguanylate cyclase/phosphodiesterase [Acidiferrobacterales bacterium]